MAICEEKRGYWIGGAIQGLVCSKGFLQRPGVDFSDVYAPVSSKAGLRVLLSAITHRKMFVRQLDIKTAFLNGELDPNLDLYCHQPEGFRVSASTRQ